jgi:defect-in-organelle-trafficking protein DotB
LPIWTGETAYDANVSVTLHSREDITRVLLAAVRLGASDVYLQTGRPVLAAVNGRLTALTPSWMPAHRMERIAVELTGVDSIMSKLYAGRDFDHAFHIPDDRLRDEHQEPVKHRFRLNLTPNYCEGDVGIQGVCRYIPSAPPSTADVSLENEIVVESTPAQGAVIIAGETGSGKTTTFAALIRRILEGDTPIEGNIITYEAPIEFVFEAVSSPTCTISQHEIGVHLPDFASGVRNALRRKPGLIVVGELRDMDTIMAAVEAANTGHPLYTTTHANNVALVLRRLSLKFPADLQSQGFHDVLATTHMIVSQVLVPKVGGGRVCLREWQVLTDEIRREVEREGMERSAVTMQSIIRRNEGGRSMDRTVRTALAQSLIDPKTAQRVLQRYGYHHADVLAAA